MTASDTAPAPLTEDPPVSAGAGPRAWLVTGLLVLFMMVNFADKSVLGLAADQIRADLHLTAAQFGLANSAFFLLFSLSAIAVGLLADRVRPKYLLLIMAVLWSVAQTPAALGGGLAILVGSRVVLGAAEGPAFPVAQQSAFSWFPGHRRNLPGALLTVGFSLGGSFAGLAATTVANLVPSPRHGGALGAMNAAVTTAGLLAPAVTGLMIDAQGNAGYQTAVLVSGALLLLGAIAAFTLIDPDRDAAALRS